MGKISTNIIFYLGLLMLMPHGILAQPVYQKLSIGMPLESLNKLDLGAEINAQDYRSVLTRYGIARIDTEAMKQYFDLSTKTWEGIKVELKNNKLKGYVLQSNPAVEVDHFKKVFSDLIQQYGSQFHIKPFQSFYEKGHQVVWYSQGERVSLRMVLQSDNLSRISIKKTEWLLKVPKYQADVQKAFLILGPILGKDYFNLNPTQLAQK